MFTLYPCSKLLETFRRVGLQQKTFFLGNSKFNKWHKIEGDTAAVSFCILGLYNEYLFSMDKSSIPDIRYFFISRLQPRFRRKELRLYRNGTKANTILKYQPTQWKNWKLIKMKKFFGGFGGWVLTNVVPLMPIGKIIQPFRGRRDFYKLIKFF